MPHLIGLVLLGAGAIAAYKAVVRAAERMSAELRRAEEEARQAHAEAAQGSIEKDLGALELDLASGVYRPRRT